FAAKEGQRHALTRAQVVQNAVARVDLFAVNRDQFVAGVDAAFISWRSGYDAGHDDAVSVGSRANAERARFISLAGRVWRAGPVAFGQLQSGFVEIGGEIDLVVARDKPVPEIGQVDARDLFKRGLQLGVGEARLRQAVIFQQQPHYVVERFR